MSGGVPDFVTAFQSTLLRQGMDAQFEATVTGSPPPRVSWTRRGEPMAQSDKYQTFYNPTTGKVMLTIRNIGPGDEGEYDCILENAYGRVSSCVSICSRGKDDQ